MGKILKGIVGGVSGTVGPVVGAIVRGIATVRSRPKKSSKPPKQSQILQRSKFGMALKFIKSVKSVVNIGFQSVKTMNGSNAAMRDLLNNAIIGVAPDYKIDFPNVTLSKGSLPDAYTMRVMPPLPDLEVVINWNPAELSADIMLSRGTDRIVVFMYDEDTRRSLSITGAAARSAGTYQISMPVAFEGKTVHVWAFFVSDDREFSSPSQYLGTIIPIL